jgi:hypothetical protein
LFSANGFYDAGSIFSMPMLEEEDCFDILVNNNNQLKSDTDDNR